MDWIWQQRDWPAFRFDDKELADFENEFLHKAGMFYGALRHVDDDERNALTIQLISEEAVKTSAIEGEILDRESVQFSIQRQLGLTTPPKKIPSAEQGISEMMVDVYKTYNNSLSHDVLYGWHKMLTNGRNDLRDIGCYRTYNEPMQIISSSLHETKVYYEAPPSNMMMGEMTVFLSWFNQVSREQKIGALARSGIAHLYFESIHPFEDGNGRIGRAISEKALSQNLERPTLIALSQMIEERKKEYYASLQRNSSGDLDVTDWLIFFSRIVLDAQDYTQSMIDFLIGKTKFYDRFAGNLNSRQEKVIARMFKEGHQGFKGGLSADNYIRMTGAPRATATRDLQDLVAKGAFTRTGELRYTRYHLNIGL